MKCICSLIFLQNFNFIDIKCKLVLDILNWSYLVTVFTVVTCNYHLTLYWHWGCCLVGVCSLLTLTRGYSLPEVGKVRLWVWGDSSACPAGHSPLRHGTWLNIVIAMLSLNLVTGHCDRWSIMQQIAFLEQILQFNLKQKTREDFITT